MPEGPIPRAADRPEDPPEQLALRLDGFEGPLDLLLDLARAQKLDLARISILALVEQYLAVIESARRIRLELAADWLVMAAWLAWLKSRLLLPPAERGEQAVEAADLLALRLAALDCVRAGAAWLGQRPRLGQDVFALGVGEDHVWRDRSRLAADLPGLIRALLDARRRAAGRRPYTPRPVTVWTLRDALERLRRLLPVVPGWVDLFGFLPELATQDPLGQRAACASTLLAGLELARSGHAALRQVQPFGAIEIAPP